VTFIVILSLRIYFSIFLALKHKLVLILLLIIFL